MLELLGTTAITVVVIGALGITTSRFRIVVPTNGVHVVQSGKHSIVFGKGQSAGNVYYHWPSWLPHIGVRVTTLPASVFDLRLNDYAAYDQERLPFIIDVIGFFRINDFSIASERVSTIQDLEHQLEFILKGAIRTILASSGLEEILEGRTKFGEMFTKEVDLQLREWGLSTVKNLELMDIRDAAGSQVIANIMAKKQSEIEKESRIKVALNKQLAQTAEIEAKQIVEVRAQEAEQLVGVRKAERDKVVGIQDQLARQAVELEAAKTATNEMAVKQISMVRQAEITRDAGVIEADQQRQIVIKQAEGDKQKKTLTADGDLYQAEQFAKATRLKGEADGSAQTAVLMAPVNSQIALAKEIGSNEGYQHYLVSLKQIEAGQFVGVEAAKALSSADIKIVSTAGKPMDGMKSIMDLVTPAGASQLGAALESLANMPVIQEVISKINGGSAAPGIH